jgi:hypothetical protein
VPPGSTPTVDLYTQLGVADDATTDEIAAAFRAKAKDLHPDRTSDPRAVEEFKELSRAYVTLTRPETRAAYDDRRRAAATSTRAAAADVPLRRKHELLGTRGKALGALWGGIVCVVVGLAIAPVVAGLPSGSDTVGRDVTLWIVVAKLVICGAILIGLGWWRLVTLRHAPSLVGVPSDASSKGPPGPTEQ